MSTTKRVKGDYNINTVDSSSNVIIDTHTVQVIGNLDVVGDITYVSSTELEVTDPFMTIAANNLGTYSNIGFLAQYAANTYAALRYNTTLSRWEVSDDNVTFSPLGEAAGPDGAVQFNESGAFQGDVDFTYDRSNLTLVVNGFQNFTDSGLAVSTPANGVTMYANVTSSGGTGMYVKSSDVDDELVSKSKAIVFGIIF